MSSGLFLLVLIVAAALGVPLAVATTARILVRGRAEFRARVLETIAAAVRRDLAVEPQFLWLIAHDERGRRRRSILHAAHRLDEGAPLSSALGDTLGLSPAATASIAAAEGGPRLAETLRDVARSDRGSLHFSHRLVLRLAYPAVILGFLGGFMDWGIAPKLLHVADSMDVDGTGFYDSVHFTRVVAGVLLALLALAVAARFRPFSWIVSRASVLGRTMTNARCGGWLIALSSAVRAGRPLGEALDRTADATGHAPHARAVRVVAHAVAEGDDVADAWSRLPIPGWVASRAALLAGTPQQCAAALDELARLAIERADATRERFLGYVSPFLLLSCGACLALVIAEFHLLYSALRDGAQPW